MNRQPGNVRQARPAWDRVASIVAALLVGSACLTANCKAGTPAAGSEAGNIPACSAEELACFRAEVVAVSDGDTIRVHGATGRALTIRLAEIDAPEMEQPGAKEATKALADLVLSRTIIVRIFDIDIHRRVVGRVYVDGMYVNAEMVARGHAWAYTRYLQDRSLAELEEQARRSKLGLWAAAGEPVPPWEWRRRPRK